MGFDNIVRKGVALAHKLTTSLQDTCVHYAWTGTNDASEDIYNSGTNRLALVEMKQSLRYGPDNAPVVSVATLTFLVPITAEGSDNRREPIDPRDRRKHNDDFQG
jgi:hypothetical protein